jgi:predicted transcriptional regulator
VPDAPAVSSRPAARVGRPLKIFKLAKSLNVIITTIENKEKKEAKNQLDRIGKIREHIK